ncbi:hypothetical protein [Pectobacterium betavasculorum]|nr:hypothetical protein [Pectobacterium betavasculorum]
MLSHFVNLREGDVHQLDTAMLFWLVKFVPDEFVLLLSRYDADR